jgi:hypothetical protein
VHGRVCAYCNRGLPGNDRGDIDHLRPKNPVFGDESHGGYWWIAYALDNYFLSCSSCNSVYKANRFPVRAGGSRFTFTQRAHLHDEARLLLDPARDPVENWLRVEFVRPLCPVGPAPGLAATALEQVEESLLFFRINEDPYLVNDRMHHRDDVLRELDGRKFAQVRDRAMRFRPHSLVARQILIAHNQRLPTPAEELESLTGETLKDLDLVLALLQPGKVRQSLQDAAERFMSEILWSLAALWKAPPPGTLTSRQVERMLEQQDVESVVKPLYEQL